MERKKIYEMTRKEFEQVPYRESWDSEVKCWSLIILPTRRKHSSGYRCMDFVAVDKSNYPICRCSGCSDVINLNYFTEQTQTQTDWNIDCLYKSGLLRLFSFRGEFYVGAALSNMILTRVN